MLKLRYYFRLTIAFINRFKALLIIAFFIGLLVFLVLRFFLGRGANYGIDKIGVTGRFATNTLPLNILSRISRGLTQINEDGSVSPGIAKSWETPDKGKTWIFKIDTTQSWQDGKILKSSDLSYEFSDVTVSYPDNETIEFKLLNNYSAFPYVVSRPAFKKGLLGLSEWKVKKLQLSGNYVESITLVNPQKNTILYKFYPSEERTKLALKLGQVHKLIDISDASEFTNWKNLIISDATNTGEYAGVFFNTEDPILSEKTLRQALSYAIDKSEYGDSRAINPISSSSWAYNSQVKSYNYDPEKAKEVISQYKKDSQSEEVVIKLQTYPILLPTAERIAKYWEDAGVKVTLESITTEPTEFQAFLAIFDIPEDPDQYSIWHSTQTATNITRYSNPRIDKLLEDGRSEIEFSERRRIYLDFQRFLVEDAPAAFLYYPKTYTISRK